jgi:hypothetical protein
MQRRTFLKLAASTTVAAGARIAFPWAAAAATGPVSYAGALYRPGGAGKIETSVDGGKTWAVHSDLGDMYSVNTLAVRNGRLSLSVGYARRTFSLVLGQDKRSWLTA